MPDNYSLSKNYPKSNFLIGSKYRANIIENKIMALALANQERMKIDAGGTIRVSISAGELRAAIGGNEGSFYSRLKAVSKTLNNRQIGMFDDDRRKFSFYQIVQTCDYEDGEFSITFNSDLSKYIVDIKKKFTILNLERMLSFDSDYAFRLYENLRSKCFDIDPEYDRCKIPWEVDYSLSELMLLLGVVDAADDEAEKVLGNEKNPDYDRAVRVAQKKKIGLLEWSPFRRCVLQKAQKEINEKTEITVSFSPQARGRGGKVVGVHFEILLKGEAENTQPPDIIDIKPAQEAKLSEEERIDFLINLGMMLAYYSLKPRDLKIIAEHGNWDMDMIRKAVDVLNHTTDTVSNPVGFIIKAMDNGWETPIPKQGRSGKEKGASFSNFKMDAEIDCNAIARKKAQERKPHNDAE